MAQQQVVPVDFGNMPVGTVLTATLSGPVAFPDNTQSLSQTLAVMSGRLNLVVHATSGGAIGDGIYLQSSAGGRQIAVAGSIGWGVNLPILAHNGRPSQAGLVPAPASTPAPGAR